MEFDADQQATLTSNYSSDNCTSNHNCTESEFIHTSLISKGKRTKRHRHHHTPSPPPPTGASSTTTTTTTLPGESWSTSASTAEEASAGSIITEEEEDMANCLILLARGVHRDIEAKQRPQTPANDDTGVSTEKFTTQQFAETGKAEFYECKTCNKCFPSFQALGGHRASHKKPKLTAPATTEENKLTVNDDMLHLSMNSFSKSLSMKPKVHECSICGAEFNSGQALGGHMRRHRPLVSASAADHHGRELVVDNKERSMLSLDLNLPAPVSDEELQQPETAAFGFVTPWINCHY